MDASQALGEPRSGSRSLLRFNLASGDLIGGLRRSWIWTRMAHQDIRLRYRGSVLGPLWLTLNAAVLIAAMGLLYSELFHMDIRTYLPYLTLGIIFFNYISSTVNESCQTFLAVGGIIHQVPLPFSLYAYRVTYRNLIIGAHSMAIIPFVWLIFPPSLGLSAIAVIPAIALLALNGIWLSIFLGMICARFRDIPPIVASVLQVIFLITPVFWSPDLLHTWKTVAELNPVFALIDVARAPLLGVDPAPYSWLIAIAFTVVGCTGTLLFFTRFRSRIAYWI